MQVIQMIREIDLVENSILQSKVNFIIDPQLWHSFDDGIKNVIDAEWQEVKFFTGDKEKNPEMDLIPSDKGGIYAFVIKPSIIPNVHMYLMYVGRAHISQQQNLKKRCMRYYNDCRPKIKRMIEYWWEYVYIEFLPLDDNTIIDNVEKELINKLIPPCNDEIPNQTIRNAVKAFSM